MITIVGTYFIVAHFALKNLSDQSANDVKSAFGNTTILIVAHPDDETMFFGPMILNLIKNNKSIDILCLTNGNSDGIGWRREKELVNVIEAFGSSLTLNVINDNKLPDSMSTSWDIDYVNHYILKHIRQHTRPVETIITFDSFGVSGHPNHRSIYLAIWQLRKELQELKINLLVLKSVSIWRKYTFFLDSIFTVISNYLKNVGMQQQAVTLSISLSEYTSLRRILQLHRTQMVWFRQLYMIFSRYMFINEFEYLV